MDSVPKVTELRRSRNPDVPSVPNEVTTALTSMFAQAVNGRPEEFRSSAARLRCLISPDQKAPGSRELHDAFDSFVGDVLTSRQQRSELQRLLKTSHDLLAAPASDELLALIVEASRDLVDSDVAHVNLHSTTGDHFDVTRATTGVRTEEFRRQHTPSGSGLTGLIMRSRRPYVTSDYLSDDRIHHDSSGDASIAADSLVTMAGVPVIHGGELFGVLIASWRRRVAVSQNQLDVLSALATLAALAVASDRLRAETTQARRELENANALIQENYEYLAWSESAHDRLTELLHNGGSVSDVADTLRTLMNADVVILGPKGSELAASTSTNAAPLRLGSGSIGKVGASGRAQTVDDTQGRPGWAAAARSGDEVLAVLAVKRLDLRDIEQRTLERAATTVALLLSTQNALAEAQYRSVEEALVDVLSSSRVDSAVARIRAWGVDLTEPTVILVASTTRPDRRVAQSTARRFAADLGGLSGELHDHTVVLIGGTDPDRFARELWNALADAGVAATVGGDGPCMSASLLPTAYAQATRCADALSRLGGTGAATARSLGFVGLLLGNGRPNDLVQFVDDRIGPLIRHDSEKSTDLIATLQSYLQHNGSLRAAAHDLTVHANTVLQRLQRIEKLLNINLQSPGMRTELDLALRTRAMLDAVNQ